MTPKDQLKKLIDDLPEAIAGEVLDFAEFLRRKHLERTYEVDLVPTAEAAGDEESSPLKTAWAAYQHECRNTLEDLRDELGL